MAQLLVRNLDESLVDELKLRARANGRSAEAEVRLILAAALRPQEEKRRTLSEIVASARRTMPNKDIVEHVRALRDEWE